MQLIYWWHTFKTGTYNKLYLVIICSSTSIISTVKNNITEKIHKWTDYVHCYLFILWISNLIKKIVLEIRKENKSESSVLCPGPVSSTEGLLLSVEEEIISH